MKTSQINLINKTVKVSLKADPEGEVIAAKLLIKTNDLSTELTLHISELTKLGQFLIDVAENQFDIES